MFSILNQAQESAEQELAQTILERKQALAELTSKSPKSEILNHHHNWADKLHAAILNYTCAANMSIIARILKLPRELRDEIYKHLWAFEEDQDPNRALLYWWDSFDEPWFQKDEDVSKSPWLTTPTKGLRPPHFVDKAFVGPEAAREILKCFKDVIGKDLRPAGEKYPVGECGLLDVSMQDFVQKDVFGVGMTMEELTRNLDLRVSFQCDALVENDALEEIQKTTANAEDSRESIQEEYLPELDDGATAFLNIPVTDRVIIRDEHSQHLKLRPRIITLAIRQESDFRGSVFLDILALVSRVCKGLRTKGFTVKIQYYSEAIALKILFKDDVWEWAGADRRPNMTRNNMFGEHVRARGSGTRAYVWAQLKEYLFCDSSDTASSRNSQR